jgi:hypothetical protein
MARRERPFRIPPPHLREVPLAEIHLRGTSTLYSRRGGAYERRGVRRASFGTTLPLYEESYFAPARASSHQAWAERFEATMHAAAERALEQSGLVQTAGAYILQEPPHRPVLLVNMIPLIRLSREPLKPYLSGDQKPYRAGYEWALVNGEARRTFIESRLPDPADLRSQGGRFLRVELTPAEYKRAFREAERRARRAGIDLRASLEDFLQRDRRYADEFNRAVDEGRKAEWNRLAIAQNALHDRHGWSDVLRALGHSRRPPRLEETGLHARNAYTYFVGEHVKKALLAKAYKRLAPELRKIRQRLTRPR